MFHWPTKWGFVLILCLVCCTTRAADQLGGKSGEQPVNVVFFLADDVNKEYYGCYGHPNTPAPTLSEFAKQGMVFDRMFTGQAICAPSRSMAYTGKYPLRNGAFKNHTQVYPSTKTIYHFMKDLDYDVILCGKSHVSPKGSFPWTVEMESVEPTGDKSTYTRPEQTNLASNPEFAEIKAELRNRLQAWLLQQSDFLAKPGNMPLLHKSDEFRLDREHPRSKRGLPPELKNSLQPSELYRHTP